MNRPSPPIVEAKGSVAFLYIHKSLAPGAVSRKSILAGVNDHFAELEVMWRYHFV